MRSQIKTSSKVPTKVEVSLPRNQRKQFAFWYSCFVCCKLFYITASNMAYPACIINGAAVTKTFQILYRNEEVRLEDVINFRIHTIVEAGKVNNQSSKLYLKLNFCGVTTKINLALK